MMTTAGVRTVTSPGVSSAGLQRCVALHGGVSPVLSSSVLTSAPQKKPWQRPFIARVRRRSPSRVAGGIGDAKASRISPAVTRSQKQTTRP